MKKFLVTLICVLAMTFSTAQAAMLNIADADAENVHFAMTTILNQVPDIPIALTQLTRANSLDIAAQGLSAWHYYYSAKTSPQPYRETILFTNSTGNVSTAKIIAYSNEQGEEAGSVAGLLLMICGLNETEVNTFLNKMEYTESEDFGKSQIWCSATQRNIVMIVTARTDSADGIEITLTANDGN